MKKILISCCLFLVLTAVSFAQQTEYVLKEQISYVSSNADSYQKEKCLLDVYYPKNKKDFVTVIWFHGGGLVEGRKEIPSFLKDKGIAVVGVGYRFAPKVKVDDIIKDAALAVKWTFDHIAELGGNKNKIVLSGHSAGAYLDLMLALNKKYLTEVGLSSQDFMGIVPMSPQVITHAAARKEKGIEMLQPTIDEFAPLYWVRKETAPITLITGDRELEMVGRYEENAYLERMLKLVGHSNIKLIELEGYGHDMVYPALPLLLREIEHWNK